MHSSTGVNSFNKTFVSNGNSTLNSKSNYNEKHYSSNYMGQDVLGEKVSFNIRNRIQYYQEENEKLETIFNQLKLNITGSCSTLDWDTTKVLNELCDIQELFGVEELSASAICMAEISNFSKDNSNYLERLKSTTKLYMDINKKLSENIIILSSELEESKRHIDRLFDISSEEIYLLEKKVVSYENELAKFEKKYPWLKDPKLDLTFISKEAQVLSNLLEERNDLEKNLSIYQGLKPDIQEASQQLILVKEQYEELKKKFHNNGRSILK